MRQAGSPLLRLATLTAALVVGLTAASPRAGAQRIGVTVTLDAASTKIVITPPNQSARPNTKVVYMFGVRNATGTMQTFQLSLTTSARWKATLPQNPKGKTPPLNPGQVASVPVEVTVPKTASIGSTGFTTLKATSMGKAKATGQGTVITTVVATLGLSLTLGEGKTARAGERVRYQARLVNETGRPQQVVVRGESGHGWRVTVNGENSTTVALPAGGSVGLMCQVAVPKDAESGPDVVVVSAELVGSPETRAQGLAVTQIGPPEPPGAVPEGEQ